MHSAHTLPTQMETERGRGFESSHQQPCSTGLERGKRERVCRKSRAAHSIDQETDIVSTELSSPLTSDYNSKLPNTPTQTYTHAATECAIHKLQQEKQERERERSREKAHVRVQQQSIISRFHPNTDSRGPSLLPRRKTLKWSSDLVQRPRCVWLASRPTCCLLPVLHRCAILFFFLFLFI